MSLFAKIKRKIYGKQHSPKSDPREVRYEMITQNRDGTVQYMGNIYKSDIVCSCVRFQARAVSRLSPVMIRQEGEDVIRDPEPYIKLLLKKPNPLMNGNQYRYKIGGILGYNGNAFVWIQRNANGIPIALYPITATRVVKFIGKDKAIWLRFYLAPPSSKIVEFPYRDILHYRSDFIEGEFFATSPAEKLSQLMEVLGSVDAGIVNTIKHLGLVRWLLKKLVPRSSEQLKKDAETFVKTYTQTDGDEIGTGTGVAAIDSNTELKPIEPKDQMPSGEVLKSTKSRVHEFYGTNEKLLQSDFDDEDWNGYYTNIVEPIANEMSQVDTYGLLMWSDISNGDEIIYEAENLSCATLKSKIELREMVDRGAMTPNEWRRIALRKGPLPGGDEPIRRLDTQPVTTQNS